MSFNDMTTLLMKDKKAQKAAAVSATAFGAGRMASRAVANAIEDNQSTQILRAADDEHRKQLPKSKQKAADGELQMSLVLKDMVQCFTKSTEMMTTHMQETRLCMERIMTDYKTQHDKMMINYKAQQVKMDRFMTETKRQQLKMDTFMIENKKEQKRTREETQEMLKEMMSQPSAKMSKVPMAYKEGTMEWIKANWKTKVLRRSTAQDVHKDLWISEIQFAVSQKWKVTLSTQEVRSLMATHYAMFKANHITCKVVRHDGVEELRTSRGYKNFQMAF